MHQGNYCRVDKENLEILFGVSNIIIHFNMAIHLPDGVNTNN